MCWRATTMENNSLPSSRAELLALYQSRTTRDVSWHFTIDTDGTVIQQADAALWMCWHAGHANGWSVGIELVQQPGSGDLYEVQIASLAAIVEALWAASQEPDAAVRHEALIALSRLQHRAVAEPLQAEIRRDCLLYTSPSPRDRTRSRMPSSA